MLTVVTSMIDVLYVALPGIDGYCKVSCQTRGSLSSAFTNKMMYRKHRMLEIHPRPCKSHHLFYLRTHFRLETVNCAFRTNRFIGAEGTFCYPIYSIIRQLFAVFTEFTSIMVMLTKHLYH